MAMDPRKRQKKLERRKSKANAKIKAASGRDPRELTARIERAAAAPILHCCTTNVLWDEGMSNVLVSRKLGSGNVAFAAFLVDMYCLGVKDVTFDVVSRSRYERQVYNKLLRDYEVVSLKPEAARKLIEGAVGYASRIGFPPHRDYLKAMLILGDIDAVSCREEFTYGKDGKPYFVAGPHDSPSRCSQIIHRLAERCGPDGFHCFMPLSASGAMPTGVRVLAIDNGADVKEASR